MMEDVQCSTTFQILPPHHPFDIDRISAVSNSRMAPIEPLYGAISTEEDHPCEHEEDHDRKPKSKCPKIFTIVFSITTLIFGLQALRMSLRPEVQCIGHRFGEGYETEWGTIILTHSKSSIY
jgi:hypothetical protein